MEISEILVNEQWGKLHTETVFPVCNTLHFCFEIGRNLCLKLIQFSTVWCEFYTPKLENTELELSGKCKYIPKEEKNTIFKCSESGYKGWDGGKSAISTRRIILQSNFLLSILQAGSAIDKTTTQVSCSNPFRHSPSLTIPPPHHLLQRQCKTSSFC